MTTVLLRTLLFVPGNRERFIAKLAELRPDAVVLDLEDAVPPAEKAGARLTVRRAIGQLDVSRFAVFVRVNGLGSGLIGEDLRAVVVPGLDGVFLPKVESVSDVHQANMLLAHAEQRSGLGVGSIRLVPVLETVRGVLDARAILSAGPRVLAAAFGAEDFTLDLGVQRSRDGWETFYPRAHLALAARAAGVLAIDGPWSDIGDEEGLVAEARLARQLGFSGKQVIHPSQIGPVNRVFAPQPEELAWARRVVEAYEAATARGEGSVAVDGKLIDVPMVERARRLLAEARTVAERGEENGR